MERARNTSTTAMLKALAPDRKFMIRMNAKRAIKTKFNAMRLRYLVCQIDFLSSALCPSVESTKPSDVRPSRVARESLAGGPRSAEAQEPHWRL